ncbi:MAG: DinB family protein [Bacteroidota bacterium]
MTKKTFRTGAIGALMDEYERAALDLKNVIEKLPQDKFVKIYDHNTLDEHCRSIITIMKHVVAAGYRYGNQIRIFLGLVPIIPEYKIETPRDAIRALDKVLTFTANTIEGHWNMDENQIVATRQETKWGLYDIEMMFEHAIVHLLRHRRQIEKFLISD